MEPAKTVSELEAKVLAKSRTMARVVADSSDLENLCFVGDKARVATAAERELLSLYAQATKMWRRSLGIEMPPWFTPVACVICQPSYEEKFWPGLAELGDHEGFHCADLEHMMRFHSVAPETRNCCAPSYHPDRPYAWRSSFIESIEMDSSTKVVVNMVELSQPQPHSDEKHPDSAPD